ncbi:hypothetical protein [Kribbella sp. NPDC048915]|uniref:HAAS signaling domain-containing protein n=1 Tax=Kribbella sp. NPDC048915 TaxID=3155148 RepID=UPI0033EC5257
MNSTLTGAVASYLTQVRAELSDLPPGELEDVLQDVTDHLSEVAGELGDSPSFGDLQNRLGTPRQYADELRTAAGYPARTEPAGEDQLKAAGRALVWGLIAATVGPFFVAVAIFAWSHDLTAFFGVVGFGVLFAASTLGLRALRDNDPRIVLDTPRGARGAAAIRGWIDQIPDNVRHELVTIGQPVWWVVRGMIGAGGFFALFGAMSVTVVGAIAGAALSVWIGRRTQQDRRWLWYVVPLNVVAAVVVPAFLAAAYAGASFGFLNNYGRDDRSNYYPPDGLTLNGNPVTNIYPFDAQGNQLSVRLYDQDGMPISLPLQDCAANFRKRPVDTSSNVFPQAVVTPDENGDYLADDPDKCKDTTTAPFTPPPAPVATTSVSPTPTPTPAAPTGKSTPGVTLTVKPTR